MAVLRWSVVTCCLIMRRSVVQIAENRGGSYQLTKDCFYRAIQAEHVCQALRWYLCCILCLWGYIETIWCFLLSPFLHDHCSGLIQAQSCVKLAIALKWNWIRDVLEKWSVLFSEMNDVLRSCRLVKKVELMSVPKVITHTIWLIEQQMY